MLSLWLPGMSVYDFCLDYMLWIWYIVIGSFQWFIFKTLPLISSFKGRLVLLWFHLSSWIAVCLLNVFQNFLPSLKASNLLTLPLRELPYVCQWEITQVIRPSSYFFGQNDLFWCKDALFVADNTIVGQGSSPVWRFLSIRWRLRLGFAYASLPIGQSKFLFFRDLLCSGQRWHRRLVARNAHHKGPSIFRRCCLVEWIHQ